MYLYTPVCIISLYICTYIRQFEKMQKYVFKICSYIQKITLNHTETFKLTIQFTKHIKNMIFVFDEKIEELLFAF